MELEDLSYSNVLHRLRSCYSKWREMKMERDALKSTLENANNKIMELETTIAGFKEKDLAAKKEKNVLCVAIKILHDEMTKEDSVSKKNGSVDENDGLWLNKGREKLVSNFGENRTASMSNNTVGENDNRAVLPIASSSQQRLANHDDNHNKSVSFSNNGISSSNVVASSNFSFGMGYAVAEKAHITEENTSHRNEPNSNLSNHVASNNESAVENTHNRENPSQISATQGATSSQFVELNEMYKDFTDIMEKDLATESIQNSNHNGGEIIKRKVELAKNGNNSSVAASTASINSIPFMSTMIPQNSTPHEINTSNFKKPRKLIYQNINEPISNSMYTCYPGGGRRPSTAYVIAGATPAQLGPRMLYAVQINPTTVAQSTSLQEIRPPPYNRHLYYTNQNPSLQEIRPQSINRDISIARIINQ
ncbi:uncharacterized protein LOC135835669 [Planococcus citri]|uniref:uncharacterized protein LOC135835669 n=1 Tax=Planococcus citri TaxID=170843 RepID=UPI0031F9573C